MPRTDRKETTMLNKEICKRCSNDRYHRIGWNQKDEEDWNKGTVWCPMKPSHIMKDTGIIVGFGRIMSVYSEPLSRCPYFLEQSLYHEQTKDH